MKKVWIAGHNGMVGSALFKIFSKKKKYKVLTVNKKKIRFKKSKRCQ